MSPTTTLSTDVVNDELASIEDWPWRLEIVRLDDVYMDRYQRPLDERWLRDREGKINPSLLGTITVSERHKKGHGKYAAVDGQHRIELARRHGYTVAAAVVFYDLTMAQEAALFSSFQRERRNITPYQRFNADLLSGDPRAKEIARIVSEEGYELGDVGTGGTTVKSVVALEKIYDDDPALLRSVLALLRDTWSGMPLSTNERMIRGTWLFLRVTPDVDHDRFVDRLSAVTPSTIVDRAQNLRDGRGINGTLPKFVAEAIENEYRSTRRKSAR